MFDIITAIGVEQARRRYDLQHSVLGDCQAARPTPGFGAVPGAPIEARGSVLFIDVESYFDQDFSLHKLCLSEYIRDPRFAVLGIGVSFRGRRHWLSAEEFRQRARTTPWGKLIVVAHNAKFDAAVLAWRFGVRPARWGDTLAMARGAHPQRSDYSLAALAEDFGLGQKLDTLATLAGVREPDAAQQAALHVYNENDLILLERLYAQLAPDYPLAELALIDLTVRQCVEPQLVVDPALLQGQIDSDATTRALALNNAGIALNDLRSANKFAELLQSNGVVPPRKLSPTTGKESFAFSIKDPEFLALRDHSTERIRHLVQGRINAMSSVTTNRAQKLLRLAALGPLPVELNYYGAATGRFSGGGGINLQNLPRDSALRHAIRAPDGHQLVGCDSAQIEARVLAWLAGQNNLLSAFRDGRDVYCEFATVFFGREITKVDVDERRVGKTAILGLGYGMGPTKFADNLKASGLILTDGDVARLVKTYRTTYADIYSVWRQAQNAVMMEGTPFGRLGLQLIDERVRLPNGLDLHYPDLTPEGRGQWRYTGRRGRETLYGSKFIENVVQALARIVVMEQQLTIAQSFSVVFSVHDEIVCCVPEELADGCKRRLLEVMATPPGWAPDLPLDCDAVVGKCYGDL